MEMMLQRLITMLRNDRTNCLSVVTQFFLNQCKRPKKLVKKNYITTLEQSLLSQMEIFCQTYFGELNTAMVCVAPSRCVLMISMTPSMEQVSVTSRVKCPGCVRSPLNVASVSCNITYLHKHVKEYIQYRTVEPRLSEPLWSQTNHPCRGSNS